jgi:hypothetical protein
MVMPNTLPVAASQSPCRQCRSSVLQTYEPGEDWFWDYTTDEFLDGPELAPPQHHPLDHPVPGPAGRVPRDWQMRLH